MTGPLFPDIEPSVVAYLADRDSLAGIDVCTLVPAERPTEFIRIERLGGPRETRVSEAARIAVEGWADTDSRAVEILNLARAELFDIEADLFGADEYAGPTRLPDPDSNMPRYTASFTIRSRAIQ